MTFDHYINIKKVTGYEESNHDCAMFCAEWVDISTGSNIGEKLKDSYRSMLEGLRLHARDGISEAVDLELKKINIEETLSPIKGDLAIMENGYPALFDGVDCVAPLPMMTGIALINKKHAIRFYRI